MSDRLDDMFPVLSPDQIGEIRAFGTERRYGKGTYLWNVGDRHVDFHVVLDGVLEIVRRDAFGHESVLFVEHPGQFSGDIVALSGRARVVAGRAGDDLRVLAVPPECLRDLVVTHAKLGEIIMRSFVLRRMKLIDEKASDTLIVGSRYSPGTQTLQDFLTRNAQPYTFLDLDTDQVLPDLLEHMEFDCADIPLVITSGGEPLRNPDLRTVARRIGLSEDLNACQVHDVAIIGAGPAGLATAVYAASEGLDVVVIDEVAPGGQAGTSSKIENYLGFPTGISGQALAGRAFVQAQKFGAQIEIPGGSSACIAATRTTNSNWTAARGSGAAPSSSRPARTTASPRSRTWVASRASACITAPRTSRHVPAMATTSSSSAAAIRRGRRRCSSPSPRHRSGSWCAVPVSPTPCRAT